MVIILIRLKYFFPSIFKNKDFDVNQRQRLGWTALQVAVINKNMEYFYNFT